MHQKITLTICLFVSKPSRRVTRKCFSPSGGCWRHVVESFERGCLLWAFLVLVSPSSRHLFYFQTQERTCHQERLSPTLATTKRTSLRRLFRSLFFFTVSITGVSLRRTGNMSSVHPHLRPMRIENGWIDVNDRADRLDENVARQNLFSGSRHRGCGVCCD